MAVSVIALYKLHTVEKAKSSNAYLILSKTHSINRYNNESLGHFSGFSKFDDFQSAHRNWIENISGLTWRPNANEFMSKEGDAPVKYKLTTETVETESLLGLSKLRWASSVPVSVGQRVKAPESAQTGATAHSRVFAMKQVIIICLKLITN